jgi:seryl-tRNA synthetase
MLDKKELLNECTIIKLKNKKFDFNFNKFIEMEDNRKETQIKLQELKQNKNAIAKKMAKDFDKNLIEEGKELNNKIKKQEEIFNNINIELQDFMLNIPNIPHEKCPIGNTEDDNIEIRKFGKIKDFDFKVKDHTELGLNLNKNIDFEKANKLAKSRFVILKDNIAKLNRVLIYFMLEEHLKNDYIEYDLPLLANKETLTGTGQLPKFSEDLFKIENEDLYLIPTGEVPLTNIFKNETFHINDLPVKVTANTHCFRKEAGAHGQDTKGMIRQHQFNKVELVQVTNKENAEKDLLNVLEDAENILKLLEIPYRVVELCTGDLGFAAKKTFDIEVWIPSQNKYREISSCSWFGDFQARRINLKYKDNNIKNYGHTINGSGLAVGRTLVAIMENNQTAEGYIKIPEILRKYFNNDIFLN